jgi:hypothetical protein
MLTRIVFTAFTALVVITSAVVIHPAAAQGGNRITGAVWSDANCDGVRQESEALLPNTRLTLRWAGANGQIDANDRDIEQSQSLTGSYAFSLAAAGEVYFVSIREEDKPAGMKPAPFRQGGDTTRDSDLTMPLAGTTLWATPAFSMPADGSPVTGIDLGLCSANATNPNLTNKLYLPLLRG